MKQEQEQIETEIVDETVEKTNEEKSIQASKSKKIWAWIFLIVAIIYGISPIDLVPDVSAVGLIDDIAIGAVAFTNLVQYQFFQTNNELTQFFKITKKILLLIAILIALVSILIIQGFQQSLL